MPDPKKPRRSPILDYADASERLHPGFGESPQPELTGTPLSGPLSGWADEIAQNLEEEAQRKAAQKPAKAKKPSAPVDAPKTKPSKAGASKTARGTSMGVAATPAERARAGLNPVAGLDVSLEDAAALPESGVTATVQALQDLITSGNPLHKNGELWIPHRPARPQKSEGGHAFRIASDYTPAGDQPTAIADLVSGVSDGDMTQVLLGVTGSGKTFTVANVIEKTQRPA